MWEGPKTERAALGEVQHNSGGGWRLGRGRAEKALLDSERH